MDLIEVFKDTLERSKEFKGTSKHKVFKEEELRAIEYESTSEIVYEQLDTVSAIVKYAAEGVRICALNFADGYDAGGLVWKGAKTQEECLCRCSNLYPSLRANDCTELYYNYNKENFSYNVCSDRLIYVRDCVFFKDKEYALMEPVKCDVITCPSQVDGYASKNDVVRRMRGIVAAAYANKVGVLILGAWGCGAFMNSWLNFKEYWLEVCAGVPKIVFAVP